MGKKPVVGRLSIGHYGPVVRTMFGEKSKMNVFPALVPTPQLPKGVHAHMCTLLCVALITRPTLTGAWQTVMELL